MYDLEKLVTESSIAGGLNSANVDQSRASVSPRSVDQGTTSSNERHAPDVINDSPAKLLRPTPRVYVFDANKQSQLIVLQQWEGFIESIDWDEGTIEVRLYDLTNEDDDIVEFAELLISDII